MSKYTNGYIHKTATAVVDALDIREGDVLLACPWWGKPEQLITARKQPDALDEANRGMLRAVWTDLKGGDPIWGGIPAVLIKANISAMARRGDLPEPIRASPHTHVHDET